MYFFHLQIDLFTSSDEVHLLVASAGFGEGLLQHRRPQGTVGTTRARPRVGWDQVIHHHGAPGTAGLGLDGVPAEGDRDHGGPGSSPLFL